MRRNRETEQEWRIAWAESHKEVDRPTWDEYFMMMAMLAATRSQDAQWQAGCVLVKSNKIIGTGYNSFPSKFKDHALPNTRPHKYPWMIHSEVNALYNCGGNPRGAICYTNGHPCLSCMMALHQAGIDDFIVTRGKATMLDNLTDQQLAEYFTFMDMASTSIVEIQVRNASTDRFAEIFQKSN